MFPAECAPLHRKMLPPTATQTPYGGLDRGRLTRIRLEPLTFFAPNALRWAEYAPSHRYSDSVEGLGRGRFGTY